MFLTYSLDIQFAYRNSSETKIGSTELGSDELCDTLTINSVLEVTQI